MGFYGSNDPTNSVKALKEVTILYFTAARDDGVAVASAGPYANHLYLAPDR